MILLDKTRCASPGVTLYCSSHQCFFSRCMILMTILYLSALHQHCLLNKWWLTIGSFYCLQFSKWNLAYIWFAKMYIKLSTFWQIRQALSKIWGLCNVKIDQQFMMLYFCTTILLGVIIRQPWRPTDRLAYSCINTSP